MFRETLDYRFSLKKNSLASCTDGTEVAEYFQEKIRECHHKTNTLSNMKNFGKRSECLLDKQTEQTYPISMRLRWQKHAAL